MTIVEQPRVVDLIEGGLAALGLRAGSTVLIHSSLRRVGFLPAGPATLLQAVRRVLGPGGTVVVPTQTANNSTTSRVYHRDTQGMDDDQRARYEAAMQGFDRATSPSFEMGAFAEHVRRQPGAVRSGHPQTSLTALGPAAVELMRVHEFRSHLGEESPLAALYEAGADVALLGVGYDSCTALHLAEYRLPVGLHRSKDYRCYVMAGGCRRLAEFRALDLDDSDFAEMGVDLDRAGFVRQEQVGQAAARLLPIRPAVDFAVDWLSRHRSKMHSNIGIDGLSSVGVAPRHP
ncbi:aminoglycoside 3-N-acetyltransferase [Allocatelliglobosispora scoriae]|uniref:Aminoglycoside N(3)-acetyltransferase n=1 Tax=Allocatelliglobosispora scoriae TaxID=643052 RepID=A0A841BLD6_9ACTN|nr:AAC(3) family N-acetyltransferase [Allocatelliglobosispora scoriae]MBB5869104.1 aminoglycoside 3-N-acetyltransferase [Allocatelliglobosispora scoriae]